MVDTADLYVRWQASLPECRARWNMGEHLGLYDTVFYITWLASRRYITPREKRWLLASIERARSGAANDDAEA